jgi:hypothetical protein
LVPGQFELAEGKISRKGAKKRKRKVTKENIVVPCDFSADPFARSRFLFFASLRETASGQILD